MSELRQLVEDSVVKLFGDHVDRDFMMQNEERGWSGELWAMCAELGLDRVLVSEQNGGMGGAWKDAYPLARTCGVYGVPLPVPEAMVGAWLVEQAGLAPRDGIPGVLPGPAPLDGSGAVSGTITRVPWGRHADYFIGLADDSGKTQLLLIANDTITVQNDVSLARDPLDDITFNDSTILERVPIDLPDDAGRWLLAMCRSAQIAGAGSACLKLGLEYTSEREQFGRPLARFQAIQHHLANMAGELATVEAMSATAFESMDRYGLKRVSDRDAKFEIAAAKCRASDAVEPLSKIGHQVHGAIGFTFEYGLHFLTRRLWSWRSELGGSAEWAEYLGKTAIDAGGDGIWGCITN